MKVFSIRHNNDFLMKFNSSLSTIVLLFIILSPASIASAPTSQEKKNYVWPVKGIEAVTGTFGEYRSSHFHMGMDFSTGGKRGLPIVSVTSGKVVQIQRYWSSIGNAVVVEHDDGIRARYGHLSKFSPKLVKYLKKSSSAKLFKSRKDFVHDLSDPIPVTVGEVIAYSGDTGIGPPHLHFELFRNGIYYNPRDFGIGITEGEEIVFDFISIKPETSRTFINGKHEPFTAKLVKGEGGYVLDSSTPEIAIQGLVSLQVSGHQKSRTNRLGLQKISSILNGNKLLELAFSALPKNQTKKFVLVYDAYKSRSNGNPFLYNLYSREGNGIPGLGQTMIGSGLISSANLNSDTDNQLSIIAGGLGENFGEAFIRLGKDGSDYSHIQTPSYITNVKSDRYTSIASIDRTVELFFPANAIFGRAKFEIEEVTGIDLQTPGLTLESKIFIITPEEFREFNLGYDLYVRLGLKSDLGKAGLYEIKKDGRATPVKKASYSAWGRFFKVRMRKTGVFAVLSDITPPEIKLVGNLKNGHVFTNSDFEIEWKIEDHGSGFDRNSIQVMVDGEPGIAEVNARKGYALIVEPERVYQPGKHKMEVTAVDRAGNRSITKIFEYSVAGGRLADASNSSEPPISTANKSTQTTRIKTKQ
jgi:hypothetical protein